MQALLQGSKGCMNINFSYGDTFCIPIRHERNFAFMHLDFKNASSFGKGLLYVPLGTSNMAFIQILEFEEQLT